MKMKKTYSQFAFRVLPVLALSFSFLFGLPLFTAGEPSVAYAKKKSRKQSCGGRTPVYEHSVLPGEMLSGIAARYGVFQHEIIRLNPKLRKNPDQIRVGQIIRVCPDIPPRERVEVQYKVRRGDTLGKIGKKFGYTVQEVIHFQPPKRARQLAKNPGSLRKGERITLWKDGEVLAAYDPGAQNKGRLKYGYKLPTNNRKYYIKRPKLVYGTKDTVRTLEKVIKRYDKKYSCPKVVVGDISKKGGGPLAGHKSHQRGIDVDLGLAYRCNGKPCWKKRFVKATEKSFDPKCTWALMYELLKTKKIRYIFVDYDLQESLYKQAKKFRSASELSTFFQYPRGKGRTSGIIRHWPKHKDHLHIRFRE